MLTWKRLIELEPRLLTLYKRALAIHNSGQQCDPLDVWIGRAGREGLKEEMKQLVGWRRKDCADLGTKAAYDLAYDKIFYEALVGEQVRLSKPIYA